MDFDVGDKVAILIKRDKHIVCPMCCGAKRIKHNNIESMCPYCINKDCEDLESMGFIIETDPQPVEYTGIITLKTWEYRQEVVFIDFPQEGLYVATIISSDNPKELRLVEKAEKTKNPKFGIKQFVSRKSKNAGGIVAKVSVALSKDGCFSTQYIVEKLTPVPQSFGNFFIAYEEDLQML